jgi:molybdopterin/thiamine biosynthesis adenylyltransferase
MYCPRIKYEHRPVRHGQDQVQIGGSIYGIAATIPDPDGWVWALLATLDGKHTVHQVVADLVQRFPAHPAEHVREALDDLHRAGYLENAAERPPSGLTAAQRERYERGQALWQWMDLSPRASRWDNQLALGAARAVVVGLGGVGSAAALALTVSGVGRVHCVEPDVIELSNLNRQILYTERDLGRAKVNVAVQYLRARNSEVEITGQRLTIDGPDTLRRLTTDCDVLLMAADTPRQIRSWTNQACWDTGTAWVHGGYHGPRVNVGLFRPGSGPCYECLRTATRERLAGLPPTTPWPGAASAMAVHAANAVSAGIAGYLAAHATMSLITGVPALRVNREYGFNLVTLEDSFALGVDRARQDCPTCGHTAA